MAGSGVSTATGAMGSLLGKLTTLLTDEYKLLKGVRKQIQFLERELSTMRVLLEKMADMEDKLDKMAKDWKGNVRDLSYDMEDCIDRFMDRLGSGEAKPKFMKRTARRLRTLWARHDIATQIKELKARVIEESERRDRYKLDERYYTPMRTVEIDPRMTALHEEVRGLVAMDGPMKHITALLTDEEEMKLKVVAIVGSGGLGKTTLAMEVYRNIGGDFHYRASVSVSRTLDFKNLLRDILSQIDEDGYSKSTSDGWEIHQLIRKTKLILTGKRYFIVIDDVWTEQDWNLIEATFPDNNNGSRIIATTRITDVTILCCSNIGGQPYQMPPLDDVDSRRLFFNRVFRSDVSCPAELAEVSARILQKCGGLPLAIITFASLLATRTHNKDEWERLQDSIGTGSLTENDGNLKGMKDILLLSYWDLPHHMRSCLLYLCITDLPKEIGKLQHLETLDLRDCDNLLRLPSTVVQLQKLVRLFVSPSTRLSAAEFGSMRALEVLEKFNIWNTDNPMKFAEELGHLTKLRKLAIEVWEEPLKDDTTRERLMEVLVSSISELGKCNLQCLSIDMRGMCEPIFGDPCCTYPYLQDLTVSGLIIMVPKGLASLSLVKLSIKVVEFDKEGLQLLMGMPSLAHLDLEIASLIVEKMTIDSNGFKLIKAFHLTLSSLEAVSAVGMRVTFAAGSMPSLRQLHLKLKPMHVAPDFCAELDVEHLPGLAHLHVKIDCHKAAPGHVEALESSIVLGFN